MTYIIFLASGGGGNFKFIYYCNEMLNLNFKFPLLIADRECGSTQFAKKKKIPVEIIRYSQKEPGKLDEILKLYPGSVVITNFHKILALSTLAIPGINFINLHYSLLPAYKGLIGMQTVEQAKKDNAQFIGASCHHLIEEVDAGKITDQLVFHANWNLDADKTYDLMFKSATLLLLNCILKKSGNTALTEYEKEIAINNTKIIFSSPLLFNYSEIFKNEIWKLL